MAAFNLYTRSSQQRPCPKACGRDGCPGTSWTEGSRAQPAGLHSLSQAEPGRTRSDGSAGWGSPRRLLSSARRTGQPHGRGSQPGGQDPVACARRLPQVPCSHSGPERSQQQAPSTPSAIPVVLGVSLRGSQGAMGRDGSTAHTRTAETRAPVLRCTSRYQRQDKAEETCGRCHPSGPGGARSDRVGCFPGGA